MIVARYWAGARLQQRQGRRQIAARCFGWSDYPACRYVQTIGSGAVHIDAQAVIDLHDRLCQATTELPLA